MRPVNDHEVLAALDRRMAGHGNGERAARELGVDSAHLRSMRSGNQTISVKVAAGLGYQLLWVKKGKANG
jgi:hypothetical protein